MDSDSSPLSSSSSLHFHLSRFVGPIEGYCYFDPSKDLIENYLEIKQDVATRWGVHYQILADPLIFSLNQVKILLHRIHYAFQNGNNISKQMEMEILLYLSLSHQIEVGLQFAGVSAKNLPKTDTVQFVQLFFGEREALNQVYENLFPKWDSNHIKSWTPPQMDEVLALVSKYQFSPHHITNYISDNQTQTQTQTQTQENQSGEMSDIQSLKNFSCEQIIDATLDLFNTSTVRLFLENVRPTKLYHSGS
ncbi:MAG: KEOPS complex subunit Cgi121 [Promethearchaeota archaeon]